MFTAWRHVHSQYSQASRRFDTDDHQTDPRGLVAFNGLKATLTGEEPESLGKATIQ